MAKSVKKAATAVPKVKAQVADAKVSKSKAAPKAEPKELTEDFEAFPSSDEEDEEEAEDAEFGGFESTDDEGDDAKPVPAQTNKKNKISEEQIKEKITASLATKPKGSKEKPGVLYIGRIPHGFYEDEMRKYFSQFGSITRLRLSRNKKTGQPKHFAFIEFESSEVARIVSETMDNYLLFGHILKVKLLNPADVHEKLFIGANKKFKAIPWTRIAKHHNDKKKSSDKWEQLQSQENSRRQKKTKTLADLGIDYNYNDVEEAKPAPKKTAKPKRKSAGRK